MNQTITGMGAATNGAAAGPAKRKRPSSLLAVANQLPSVENSLEEFIAKANQTLVDVGNWGTDKVKEQEDEKRKEIDALRWKAAETQLRESEVRESTLRTQLDSLQGKLAETEARAAVSGTMPAMPAVPAANDTIVSELRLKIARAEEKAASADMRARAAAEKLEEARLAAGSKPALEMAEPGMSDDRIRLAEAKAAKALAAARAIQAGLNVSHADLAAIESGLVVPELHEPKKTPWLAIAGAFVVGIAIMFVITKLVMKDSASAATSAAAVAPAPTGTAPTPAPVAVTPPAPVAIKPIVTPIEEPKAEEPKAAAAVPPADVPAPTPAPVAPAVAKTPAPVHHAAATPQHAAPAHAAPAHAAAPATKKAASSNIADPFADPPAKKAAAKASDKKPAAGAIADPF